LFAVHPVSGIPVNYICARDQLLSQMFWSGSLLCYLRMSARGFSVRMLAISLGLLFASLLSKGDAVLAPLVILALELTILGQPLASRRPWLRAAAFAVPVASLFILQRVAFGESEVTRVVSEGVSRTDYALTQARLHLFRYLPQFVWPFPIRQDPAIDLDHGLSLPVVCGGLFIGASLWFAWRWRREHPIASFCIATYWLMMATTSSVIPLYHIAVDYRPYPSSPFLYLALAVLALRLTLPARTALATGAIVWCAATSIFLNQTWRDDKALWSYSVEHGAGPLAHHNLAMATTDLKTRKELLEKALELAPTYFLAMINLGRALVSEGQVTRGLEYLQRAVLLTPRDAQTRFWYARTLAEAGKVKEASRESVIAAELNPSREAIMQAVMATQAAGDMEESQRWLSRLNGEPTTAIAAAVDADNDPRFGRAFTLQQQGKLDEAITVYRDFLKTYPDHAQVHFNLGYALKDKHQCQEAIRELERALELDSSKTAAHLHIAICSRELGNAQLAQLHQKTWDASQQAAVH
jgi:tetratricopeptide (TPR) repeat protein